VVVYSVTTLLQIFHKNHQWKKFECRSIFGNSTNKSLWLTFLVHPVYLSDLLHWRQSTYSAYSAVFLLWIKACTRHTVNNSTGKRYYLSGPHWCLMLSTISQRGMTINHTGPVTDRSRCLGLVHAFDVLKYLTHAWRHLPWTPGAWASTEFSKHGIRPCWFETNSSWASTGVHCFGQLRIISSPYAF